MATSLVRTRAMESSPHEVTLEGRVYASVADQLRTVLDDAAAGATTVVVDATKLESIDSVALQVFVDVLKRLRPRGGRIAVFGLSAANRRFFELTGLARIVTLVASRDEALRAGA